MYKKLLKLALGICLLLSVGCAPHIATRVARSPGSTYFPPPPTATTLGGVYSKDCSSIGLVQRINTNGTITCAAAGGGGSMTWPSSTGIPYYSGSSSWDTSLTTSGTGTTLCLTVNCILTTPNLGTPSAVVLTHGTGLPLGTGILASFIPPLILSGNNLSCQTASGALPGCLAAADYVVFSAKQAAITSYSQIVSLWTCPGGIGYLKPDGTCGSSSGMVWPGTSGIANYNGVTWGTPYIAGTAANNLVQLDSAAKLPAVDASNLINFPQLNQNTNGSSGNGYIFKGSLLLSGTINSASSLTVSIPVVAATTTTVCLGSFNGAFVGVTGFIPSTGGMLAIGSYPSTGHCNYTVVNDTANSITVSVTINVVAF